MIEIKKSHLPSFLKKLFRGRKLVGEDIEYFLGVMPSSTALNNYRRWYDDLPVKKINGKLVDYTRELKAWQAAHPEIKEEVEAILQPREIIQTRVTRTRWGLPPRVEHRRIII